MLLPVLSWLLPMNLTGYFIQGMPLSLELNTTKHS